MKNKYNLKNLGAGPVKTAVRARRTTDVLCRAICPTETVV